MNPFHQEEPVVVSDERQAVDLIMRLGVVEQLSEPVSGRNRVLFHTIHAHETHWILLVRFHGFDLPADNGHTVYTWPKAVFTAQVMDDFMHDFMAAQPALGVSELPPVRPERS